MLGKRKKKLDNNKETKNLLKLKGIIERKINDSYVKVRVEGQEKLIEAYISGRMFKNHIRVIEGDTVSIELGSNDRTKGRVVYRYQSTKG